MPTKHLSEAAPRRAACWPRAMALGCALMVQSVAHADWVIPAGAVVDAPGGATTLGCTDLSIAGVLTIGAGASITGVRNVTIQAGGSLQIASGATLQLAQQWTNQGSVSATGAQVLRVGNASCPAEGPLGPVDVQSSTGAATVTPIPTLNGAALSGLAALLGALAWRHRRRRPHRGDASSNPSHSPR